MTDLHVPDVADADALTAALAYAQAGWYVLPVQRGSKHPGSVVGGKWQAQSSRDPQQIVAWFAGATHGIALHAGRSGAVIFDVDDPDQLPDALGAAFGSTPPPMQTTRTGDPRRGHYLYRQPAGRTVGNGTGRLGKTWGEVRGRNGVIIVAPSQHEKHTAGGRYRWEQTGPVPPLPASIAELLPDAAGTVADAATDGEVRAFLEQHTAAARPALLKAVTARLGRDIAAGGSRHNATLEALCWAMREARAGLYPARAAAAELSALFTAAINGERNAGPEYAGLLSYAVAQAAAADPAQLRQAVEERAPANELAGLIPPPAEPPDDQEPPPVPDALTQAPPGTDDGPLGANLLPIRRFADVAAEVDARGPRQWLIRGIWPAGDYGVHGAEPKAGKTWNAVDLAISVASGTPWLGAVPVDTTGPVILFAGEGGDGNLVRRLRAVANARGLVADDLDIYVCTRAPKLADVAHLAILEDWITRLRPALVILDPLYLAAGGADGKDLYAMGALLEGPQVVCQRHGAALLVVTHFNRNRDAKGAGRFTGAGPAEWGRVLLAATVVTRHTDKATRATTVLTELEVTGGEVPDQTLRVRRTIRADDPDDLDSPLTYVCDLPDSADDPAQVMPTGSDLPPAALKLLEALEAQTQPAGINQLVDYIAQRHGHGLKRPTCSTHLNQLQQRGLADSIDQGAGRERLWFRTAPTATEVAA